MGAFDRWPFTNEGNPFDTDEWRDSMAAAAAEAGSVAISGDSDGDITVIQNVRNVSSGSAVVGFQAGTVTGGMTMTGRGRAAQTVVGGRIVNNGQAKTCSTCGGQSGWVIANGLEIHTGGGCGAKQ
jgi:hypothetical protein